MEMPKLDPGDVFCYKCEGKSVYCFTESRHVTEGYCNFRHCMKSINECKGLQFCLTCHGVGWLDWIENIVGKQKPYITSIKLEPKHRSLKKGWKIVPHEA